MYDNDNENLCVIDKLSLAILKAFDENKAEEWLNERRDELYRMQSVTEAAALDLEKKLGKEVARAIVEKAPNMYNLCCDRIRDVAAVIKEKGKLYDDFESAIELYREKGIVDGEAVEVVEFNSLMEFVYIGRQARCNEMLKYKDAYMLMDNLFVELDC